ncbi:hypothetical protein [Mesorhizobium sp. B2-1-2]|uniref:hypothetical protein n=1 Tax=Mesorhizobium sp. B2-1-2 TaxID=2589973 RepID=UPI00112BD5E3|nr:hypothetical protein [Mesorhizobium sp. B2-1-2]TPN11728.1 hypothetical protein FJ971_10000 [Mesorhizobium sp. B2-1-2]
MADQNINNMTVTWNAGGTTFSALKMNVTDTASAAASLLLQLQVGGSDKFKVGKDGTITGAGGLSIAGSATITGNLTVSGTLTATGIAGTVTAPASSTDNAIARFNGTTGGVLQNSTVIISDTGNLSGVGSITASSIILAAEYLFTSDQDTGLGTFAGNSVSLIAGNSIRATFTLASGNSINGNTTINGTLTVTG